MGAFEETFLRGSGSGGGGGSEASYSKEQRVQARRATAAAADPSHAASRMVHDEASLLRAGAPDPGEDGSGAGEHIA
jgi:hypothetical protein